MYFDLLKVVVDPTQRYNVYLDIKDTRGRKKVQKLHEVLSNAHYDFSREIIKKIQLVRSDEVELVQVADFIFGIVSPTIIRKAKTDTQICQGRDDFDGVEQRSTTASRPTFSCSITRKAMGESVATFGFTSAITS